MPPASPGILDLAFYLRRLRTQHWADVRLTQAALATALAGGSGLGATAVASWENRKQPTVPPVDRLAAYAQFFATRRSVQDASPSLVPVESFTPEERAEHKRLHDELLRLHSAASGTGRALETAPAPRSWLFADEGPLTIVCARLPDSTLPDMAKHKDPNYTELLSFADLDSLVELHGHVRAENPGMDVYFRTPDRVEPDHLTGHLVIIGGVGLNDMTRQFLGGFTELTTLPVTQLEDNDVDPYGEFFVTKVDGQEQRYVARWAVPGFSHLLEDVGLLARMPNPLNSGRTLTLCNGIHSRGVYGAVRSLTDARLRESNELYIARNLPGDNFGVLTRVQIIGEQAMTPDFSNPRAILHQWSAGN